MKKKLPFFPLRFARGWAMENSRLFFLRFQIFLALKQHPPPLGFLLGSSSVTHPFRVFIFDSILDAHTRTQFPTFDSHGTSFFLLKKMPCKFFFGQPLPSLPRPIWHSGGDEENPPKGLASLGRYFRTWSFVIRISHPFPRRSCLRCIHT